MKYISALVCIVALIICNSSYSESDWIGVAKTPDDGLIYEIKISTLKMEKTSEGVPIIIVVGRDTDKKTSKVDLYKWYVSLSDCENKMGRLVSLGVNGEFQFEKDFVFDGGNIASSIAKNICSSSSFFEKEINKPITKVK